jgi:DNA polymerase III delta prime subunit
MFENLLEQPAVKGRLIEDIKSSSLPSSILFYGPSYSGKMTTDI